MPLLKGVLMGLGLVFLFNIGQGVYYDIRYDGKQPDAYSHKVSNSCNEDRTKQTFVWEDVSGNRHTEHLDKCVIKPAKQDVVFGVELRPVHRPAA